VNKEKFHTAVIGAGASGITAAISASAKGSKVILCERLSEIGKKILASGSGKCNIFNTEADAKYFNPEGQRLVKSVFCMFSKENIERFFRELGLLTVVEGKRVFPVTKQAASVLKVLEIELKRLSVPIALDFEVSGVSSNAEGFEVVSLSGKRYEASKLIVASGGKSYPALGSDGSMYKFAKQFGHRIIEPVCAAVPLVVKDDLCHILQGQRILATARCMVDGKQEALAEGEILFTKYGLSGTAILDISRQVSVAINRSHKSNVYIIVDMAPFIGKEELEQELQRKINNKIPIESLLTGILPNKFGLCFKDALKAGNIEEIVSWVKEKKFIPSGTRGWNEAEFTAGGVDTSEIKEKTLESLKQEGLYFCGEILDVDGCRGGHNLAWAWASGFIAGLTQ
jgi:hypothetical protein